MNRRIHSALASPKTHAAVVDEFLWVEAAVLRAWTARSVLVDGSVS